MEVSQWEETGVGSSLGMAIPSFIPGWTSSGSSHLESVLIQKVPKIHYKTRDDQTSTAVGWKWHFTSVTFLPETHSQPPVLPWENMRQIPREGHHMIHLTSIPQNAQVQGASLAVSGKDSALPMKSTWVWPLVGAARLLSPWDSPGKNTGVGCNFLLQEIFSTQGLNPCLLHFLHWQTVSLPLSHLRSPEICKWTCPIGHKQFIEVMTLNLCNVIILFMGVNQVESNVNKYILIFHQSCFMDLKL